jgi:quercetin dioxygenase-like cupin family protein
MSELRVSADSLLPPRAGSALALRVVRLSRGESRAIGPGESDALLFVCGGAGTLSLAGRSELSTGVAGLVPAGETAMLEAGRAALEVWHAEVGPAVDLHAPMGPSETLVSIDRVEAGSATGKRSFQVLFGPHNGSTRATLFVGYIPPGASPWHFHLYDEIVGIWRGEGRYHTRGGVEPLAPGSAFRISPREVHTVENTSATDELVVLGLFTPAGSPSAAYLAGEVADYLIEAAP